MYLACLTLPCSSVRSSHHRSRTPALPVEVMDSGYAISRKGVALFRVKVTTKVESNMQNQRAWQCVPRLQANTIVLAISFCIVERQIQCASLVNVSQAFGQERYSCFIYINLYCGTKLKSKMQCASVSMNCVI